MTKYRIDVAVGPTSLTHDGITTAADADATTTVAEDIEEYTDAQEQAIVQYGHLTAAGLPVNGVYVIDTLKEPMLIKGSMTKEGWANL